MVSNSVSFQQQSTTESSRVGKVASPAIGKHPVSNTTKDSKEKSTNSSEENVIQVENINTKRNRKKTMRAGEFKQQGRK